MPCLEDDSTVVLKVCDTAPLGMVERYSRMMREEEPAEGIRNNSVKKKAFHCVSIVAWVAKGQQLKKSLGTTVIIRTFDAYDVRDSSFDCGFIPTCRDHLNGLSSMAVEGYIRNQKPSCWQIKTAEGETLSVVENLRSVYLFICENFSALVPSRTTGGWHQNSKGLHSKSFIIMFSHNSCAVLLLLIFTCSPLPPLEFMAGYYASSKGNGLQILCNICPFVSLVLYNCALWPHFSLLHGIST